MGMHVAKQKAEKGKLVNHLQVVAEKVPVVKCSGRLAASDEPDQIVHSSSMHHAPAPRLQRGRPLRREAVLV